MPRAARALVAACLLPLLVGALWLGYRGSVALGEAGAAREEVLLAERAYEVRDLRAGARHLAAARAHLAAAHRATDDPVWAAAATAPAVGDDIGAVRELLASASDLLDAVEPVARVAADTGEDGMAGLLQDGTLAPALRDAADRAAGSEQLVAELSSRRLHDAVESQVEGFGHRLELVSPVIASAADATELAPRLLAEDDPRPLLVAVQTPAEVRSLGGLVGLVLVVRLEDGRLEVVDSYPGSAVPPADAPVLVSPDLEAQYGLFGDRAGRYLVNATMLPDASDASALLAQHHRVRTGVEPTGVVLTDLTVLSRLLAVTGPVPLDDGRLLESATVDALLQNGIYVEQPDPVAQDRFFSLAARAVVDRASASRNDTIALARVLATAAGEQRLSLWSPDPRAQELITELGVTGFLLVDPTTVGLFLNDATGSKMQWYLRSAVTLTSDGTGGSTLRLELTSTAPTSGLPPYVAGGHERLGLPAGGQRVQVAVIGPVGDGPGLWRVDGSPVPSGSAVVRGRGAGVASVDVHPGQHVVVEVDLARTSGLTHQQLVLTPGVDRVGD